ncbi:MAG TPA: PKD domain-containing protein, partial [Chitinophagaceae bacterium]|nr:PKD domain-containing protein [Chitinophagaceae bacterium]
MKKNLYLFSLLLACAYLQPVYAQPDSSCTAAFYFTKSGNTVNFFSFPTLPPGTTHWWTFGDATNSSAVNPVHNYAAPGTYWVTHYIQNDSTNCRDSVVRSVTIDSTNCTIQAKFSIFRDSINCRRIYFINQSAPVSPNVTFTWRFGDGTTSNEANPVHIYPRDSVYFACLIVDAGNNCRREYCMRIEIRCDTPCNLQPDFTWRRDSIQTSKVYFINQMQATSPNTSYLWTFGDGTSSTERNPVHVYQQPGKYKVCLIAQSSPTCRREICKEVIVEKDQCNVRAKFQWKRDPIQSNKIWFANHSQPVPNIWRTAWSYGDGTFSQDFNSVHVYQRPGKYMVCLQVQSLSGCTSVYCDSVIVQPSCDSTGLRFEYRRDTLQPYRVSFRSVSNTPLTQQQWVITRL